MTVIIDLLGDVPNVALGLLDFIRIFDSAISYFAGPGLAYCYLLKVDNAL